MARVAHSGAVSIQARAAAIRTSALASFNARWKSGPSCSGTIDTRRGHGSRTNLLGMDVSSSNFCTDPAALTIRRLAIECKATSISRSSLVAMISSTLSASARAAVDWSVRNGSPHSDHAVARRGAGPMGKHFQCFAAQDRIKATIRSNRHNAQAAALSPIRYPHSKRDG